MKNKAIGLNFSMGHEANLTLLALVIDFNPIQSTYVGSFLTPHPKYHCFYPVFLSRFAGPPGNETPLDGTR